MLLESVVRLLRDDPTLATEVGKKVFPAAEANLIAKLVRRDLPYYDARLTPEFIASMNCFARDTGILKGDPLYDQVVAVSLAPLWS